MASPDHLSEVGPAVRANESGTIAGAAPTHVGAVLSAGFHLACVIFLILFGAFQGKVDAPSAMAIELVQLPPPPRVEEPEPEPEPTPPPPQPEPPKPQPKPQPKPLPTPAAKPAKAVTPTPAPQPAAQPQTPQPPQAATDSAPLMTTPPPTVSPHTPGAVAVTPVQAREGDMVDYRMLVWNRIMRFRPARVPFPGDVQLRFAIDAAGRLLSSEVTQSSGSAFLDRAALDALRRAEPFPTPPRDSTDNQRVFVLPFHFS